MPLDDIGRGRAETLVRNASKADVAKRCQRSPKHCWMSFRSRGFRLHAPFFATIRWTTLVYLENVGFQFLSLRHISE